MQFFTGRVVTKTGRNVSTFKLPGRVSERSDYLLPDVRHEPPCARTVLCPLTAELLGQRLFFCVDTHSCAAAAHPVDRLKHMMARCCVASCHGIPSAALAMLKLSTQYAGIGQNLQHQKPIDHCELCAAKRKDEQGQSTADLRNNAIPAMPTTSPVYDGCRRIAYGPLCTSLCPFRMPTSKVNNLPSWLWLHHRRPRPPHAIAAPAASCHVQG